MGCDRRTGVCVLLLTISLIPLNGSADALRRLASEGNRLLAEEKFDEALERYRSAQIESPESPHLHFNIAKALERQGKYEEAIAEYRKVYSREEPQLGAWALYNIGVCQYRQAEQAIGAQDYQKAIELLTQCMESNREAMKMDPTDEDPKFNFEQAKRKLKEVLDALKKQQEEKKKQEEQQKKDQQQQDQQKQEQQKQEQQKQEQPQPAKSDQATTQPQEKEEQPTSGTAQAEPQVGEMSPEDAERILNSLPEQNAEEMRRVLMPRGRGDYNVGKDW